VQIRKHNNPRTGLDHALHDDFDLMADLGLSVVDDDHRAVRQVGDSLTLSLPSRTSLRVKTSPGNIVGFSTRAKLMEIHAGHILQRGDFAEVVVVGIELWRSGAREPDEFGVHAIFFRKITVVDFHLVPLILLDAFATSPIRGDRGRVLMRRLSRPPVAAPSRRTAARQ